MSDNPNYPPSRLSGLDRTRAATQFGGEKANPHYSTLPHAPKPYSYRSNLEYLAAQEVDPDNMEREFKRLERPADGTAPSMARVIALRLLKKGYAKMQSGIIEKIIDNTEGKLVQPTQEIPPAVPMPEDFATEEEAAAAHAAVANL